MRAHHLSPQPPSEASERSIEPSSLLAGEKGLVGGWLQVGSTQARPESS